MYWTPPCNKLFKKNKNNLQTNQGEYDYNDGRLHDITKNNHSFIILIIFFSIKTWLKTVIIWTCNDILTYKKKLPALVNLFKNILDKTKDMVLIMAKPKYFLATWILQFRWFQNDKVVECIPNIFLCYIVKLELNIFQFLTSLLEKKILR